MKFSRKTKLFLLFFVGILSLYLISWSFDFSKGKDFKLGITFSQYYAKEQLGLDWRKTYLAILDDLNPSYLRLIAYWQYLEPEEGIFDFKDLDWQIAEAQKRDKKIILVIGHRVPRWPECHTPQWVQTQKSNLNSQILKYLEKVVQRYKDKKNIWAWQVENEPLLAAFGRCPKPDREFLKEEIAFVKSLDPTRPIIVTDSGELSLWLRTSGLSEILGTTLYRTVWSEYIGYFKHLYPPVFYTLRAWITKKFFDNQKVIISELQGEPWAPGHQSLAKFPLDEQLEHFSPKNLEKNVEFAKKTGLDEIYLWGAEWWWWLKTKKGDDRFWITAKEIFK